MGPTSESHPCELAFGMAWCRTEECATDAHKPHYVAIFSTDRIHSCTALSCTKHFEKDLSREHVIVIIACSSLYALMSDVNCDTAVERVKL